MVVYQWPADDKYGIRPRVDCYSGETSWAQVSRATPASLSSRPLLPRGLRPRKSGADPVRMFGRGCPLPQPRAAEAVKAGDSPD